MQNAQKEDYLTKAYIKTRKGKKYRLFTSYDFNLDELDLYAEFEATMTDDYFISLKNINKKQPAKIIARINETLKLDSHHLSQLAERLVNTENKMMERMDIVEKSLYDFRRFMGDDSVSDHHAGGPSARPSTMGHGTPRNLNASFQLSRYSPPNSQQNSQVHILKSPSSKSIVVPDINRPKSPSHQARHSSTNSLHSQYSNVSNNNFSPRSAIYRPSVIPKEMLLSVPECEYGARNLATGSPRVPKHNSVRLKRIGEKSDSCVDLMIEVPERESVTQVSSYTNVVFSEDHGGGFGMNFGILFGEFFTNSPKITLNTSLLAHSSSH